MTLSTLDCIEAVWVAKKRASLLFLAERGAGAWRFQRISQYEGNRDGFLLLVGRREVPPPFDVDGS